MSPTILLKDGQPYLAVGSPGGASIITSVSQTILGFLDRGLPLVDAVAAPRLSSRNGTEQAEPPIFTGPDGTYLRSLGHVLSSHSRAGRRDGDPPPRRRPVRGGGRDRTPRRRLGDGGPTAALATVIGGGPAVLAGPLLVCTLDVDH